LYSSPNVPWVIKLRRRWAGHVALWRAGEMYTGFWCGDLMDGATWKT